MKYYCLRCLAPETIPDPEGNRFEKFVKLGEPVFIEHIGSVWGWVTYEKPLSDDVVKEYGLKKGGGKNEI